MIAGKSPFIEEPEWHLNGKVLQTAQELEILGVTFVNNMDPSSHISKRISKARRSIYRYRGAGVSYPGLASNVKAHIWRTTGVPSMTFGMNCLNLNSNHIHKLESEQGSIMKALLGVGKRSHHSPILAALHIPRIRCIIQNDTLSLCRRIFACASPVRDLSVFFLSQALVDGHTTKGTLVDRLFKMNPPTLSVLLDPKSKWWHEQYRREPRDVSGTVDSLRYLLHHKDYNNPYGEHRRLASLLVRAF